MYKLNPRAELKRGFRIPSDYSVEKYVREGLYYPDLLTSDRVIVVSINHESYGFNAVSSMILESVISNKNEMDSINSIASLFRIEPERVMNDFNNVLIILLEKHIIIKED